MKKIIILSVALIAQTAFAGGLINKKVGAIASLVDTRPAHWLLTDEQINAFTDSAYTFYIESLKKVGNGGFIDNPRSIDQNLFKLIQNSLEESFKHIDPKRTGVGFVQPAIKFARRLKEKLSKVEQVIADLEVTDPKTKQELAATVSTQQAYFAALQFFQLEPAYLHTLGGLTKEQQEIDAVTTRIVNLLYGFLSCGNRCEAESVKCFEQWRDNLPQEVEAIKQLPVIEKLRNELAMANEINGNWAEAERTARNVHFFMHLLAAKAKNKSAIIQKYHVTDAETLEFCEYLTSQFSPNQILNALGFEYAQIF